MKSTEENAMWPESKLYIFYLQTDVEFLEILSDTNELMQDAL